MRLAELIADITGDVTATLPENYRATPVTYIAAPPRVANYLERPDALRALRNVPFAEDRRQAIALTAMSGMGGIGKTVLAQALTRDEVVQRAFPDDIVWITAGKEMKRDCTLGMPEVAQSPVLRASLFNLIPSHLLCSPAGCPATSQLDQSTSDLYPDQTACASSPDRL